MRYFRLLWVAAVLICSSVQLSAQSVDAFRKMSMLLRQQAQENAETKARDIREGRPTEQLMVGGLVNPHPHRPLTDCDIKTSPCNFIDILLQGDVLCA